MDIFISRPKKEDKQEIEILFHAVIADAFEADGIGDRVNGITDEIEKEMRFLENDLETNGKDVYFLLARTEQQIIGTIALAKPSKFLQKYIKINSENTPEISSVFVLPEFQGKGIGTLLFNAIVITLLHKNVTEVCLDGGYRNSQSYWIKKVGEPNVILKDYWGEGLDHMFWLRKLTNIKIK